MSKSDFLLKFASLFSLAAQGLVQSLDEAARILGISPHATLDEINKAFKQKALKAHPDLNPGGEMEMKLLNSAKEFFLSGEMPETYHEEDLREEDFTSVDEAMFDTPGCKRVAAKIESLYKAVVFRRLLAEIEKTEKDPQEVFNILWDIMNDPEEQRKATTDKNSYMDKLIKVHSDLFPEFKAFTPAQMQRFKLIAWGDALMYFATEYKEKHKI